MYFVLDSTHLFLKSQNICIKIMDINTMKANAKRET